MRKADSLRAWLVASLPMLKAHPDRLQIYLEGGTIAARRSRTLSFVYRYTLKALLTDYADDVDRLVVPVLAWIEKEQPQLLARKDGEPFSFEAELLDGDAYDVEISISLTETVTVIPRASGSGWDVTHEGEPDMSDAFAGVEASFLQGFGNLEELVRTAHPDAVITPAVPPQA